MSVNSHIIVDLLPPFEAYNVRLFVLPNIVCFYHYHLSGYDCELSFNLTPGMILKSACKVATSSPHAMLLETKSSEYIEVCIASNIEHPCLVTQTIHMNDLIVGRHTNIVL
jgi:hypothetical protein